MSADDWGLFKIVRTAVSSASRLVTAQARGVGDEGADDTAEPFDDAPLLQPLGLAALPKAASSLRLLALRFGDELFGVAAWDKSKRPTDLESGEVRLHGLEKVAAALRILATGTIRIDAESGQDVVVNAGSARVTREGDDIALGNWQFNPGTSGASLTWVAPGGGTPVVISPGGANLTGKSAGGADRFKA